MKGVTCLAQTTKTKPTQCLPGYKPRQPPLGEQDSQATTGGELAAGGAPVPTTFLRQHAEVLHSSIFKQTEKRVGSNAHRCKRPQIEGCNPPYPRTKQSFLVARLASVSTRPPPPFPSHAPPKLGVVAPPPPRLVVLEVVMGIALNIQHTQKIIYMPAYLRNSSDEFLIPTHHFFWSTMPLLLLWRTLLGVFCLLFTSLKVRSPSSTKNPPSPSPTVSLPRFEIISGDRTRNLPT